MLTDGLYVFDGFTASKIFEKTTGIIDTDANPRACFDKNKYYLAAKADFGGSESFMCETVEPEQKNALFEFDIKNMTVSILRGVNVLDVAAVKTSRAEKVFCGISSAYNGDCNGVIFETDNSGGVYGEPLPMLWASAYNALGAADKSKLIRRISLLSKYDCTLILNADGRVFEYAVKGGDAPVSVRVMKKCVQFSIAFRAEGEAEISGVVISADEYAANL
jgi:hypothetical protein